MTKLQAEKLMQAAKVDIDERLYLFVAFGLNAAMRHSEIVATRYDQVDFQNNRIFIPQAKGGAREQPITASLAAQLDERRRIEPDKTGWIFPSVNKSKYPHRKNMDAGFKRAVVAAGLSPSKVTPHIMRQTAITRLVQANVDLLTIQKISAHKTLSMVLRYTHVHASHIDQALSAIDIGL
ncbi:MAG: site-specific integrase [Sphingobium sp.]